jgi:hypothetical protein
MKSRKVGKVDVKSNAIIFSFEQQFSNLNHESMLPFHLHENNLIDGSAAETALQIIAAKKLIPKPALCRYLHEKRSSKKITDVDCYDTQSEPAGKSCAEVASGHKWRSETTCFDSVLNHVIYINQIKTKNDKKLSLLGVITKQKNAAQNFVVKNKDHVDILNEDSTQNQESKSDKSKTVFEDLFDFLNFQTTSQNQKQVLTNFLPVNTLDFFERSLQPIVKYKQIGSYLKHYNKRKNCNQQVLNRSVRYIHERAADKRLIQFCMLQPLQHLDKSEGIRLS